MLLERRNWRFVAVAWAFAVLGGCASLRNGGAPDPAYSVQADLESLQEQFKEAAGIENFYKGSKDEAARNEFLDARIALANLAYIKFISELTADKQHLDAASDMLVLGLSLLG